MAVKSGREKRIDVVQMQQSRQISCQDKKLFCFTVFVNILRKIVSP